jgi:L,D-transpeptidase YbiS
MRIAVSSATQTLRLWDGHRLLKQWPCSTSKYGIGFVEGSNKTPLGHFSIAEKHGHGAALGTVFKARVPVGLWKPGQATKEDLVLTRILRLEGLEPRNANTFTRYIYIHGTTDEHGMGKPGSHGCVRLRNDHMIELFDLVPLGTLVGIDE